MSVFSNWHSTLLLVTKWIIYHHRTFIPDSPEHFLSGSLSYNELLRGVDYILSPLIRTYYHLVSEPSNFVVGLVADCSLSWNFYHWLRLLTVFLHI